MAAKTSWTGCKVSYGISDPDPIWDHFDNAGRGGLPEGWSLVETDCSGARCVAIFRVDVAPTLADGHAVATLIAQAEGA